MTFATTTALVVLLLAMAVLVIRALRGPTVQDRILAANAFGTTTVLWICVYALFSGRDDIVDIATIYALTCFVATIAGLKYVERGDLGVGLRRDVDRKS